MKDPFDKSYPTGMIVGIAAGLAAGIGLGWLYLTDNGAVYRQRLTGKIKEKASDKAAKVVSKKTIIPKKVAKVVTDAVIK
jgi:hypothetical protein